MKKYFGTDGIRGEANRELTVDLALRLGYALGTYLMKKNISDKPTKVIMGTDTRVSGYMLRSALTAGLNSVGVSIDFVGVIPTPGVAYITASTQEAAGIMISASHNPAKDNGIKIFNSDGYKLNDEQEKEIESLMDNYEALLQNPLAGDSVGRFKYAEEKYYLYKTHLLSTIKTDFKGLKIVVDSANGAAYRISKEIFSKLHADIISINDIPNGYNINVKCGSTHPEILSKVVLGYEADLGLAYDGDADRLIAVDRFGNVIDGDKIIALLSLEMKANRKLPNNRVVTTIMSNMGLEHYLKTNDIELIRAGVGDRYVLEKMLELGVSIGGEQSGHIILNEYGTTGDGVLTSIKLVELIKNSGLSLDELIKDIQDWPQKLLNIKVDNSKKNTWNKNKDVTDFILLKEKELNDNGRVLVRTSGTEPLIRVMVEGINEEQVERISREIAKKVEQELS